MIHRMFLGRLPDKPHTTFYDEDGKLLMEQMVTREGFNGPFSILYYRIPPTDEFDVAELELPGFCPFTLVDKQPLHRRHIRSQDMKPGGNFLTGRQTLMVNDTLQIGVVKPTEAPTDFFSNGDGDECWFIKEGSGWMESVYGRLAFAKHDYILIPRSTAYRLHFDGNTGTAMVFEGAPRIDIPKDYRVALGQISDYAPFTHRDFGVPTELLDASTYSGGCNIVTKMSDQLTVHKYRHFPFDVVGWDGMVYPVTFNIHKFQPKTALVHLPPTIHTTFAGKDFVICSFVPRHTDFHENAIPCPYAHASVDMDEILYYVEGNFASRKGIESESISLHPLGISHGPHPGTYEGSIGKTRTDELAVMCDAYAPFRLTTVAAGIDEADYHKTWVTKEGESTWKDR